MDEDKIQIEPNANEKLRDDIISVISTIYDPEIPVNIFEMGLIYEVVVLPPGKVTVTMTLTSPNCPAAQSLPAEVKTKVESIPGISEAEVDITFDPPWEMSMMSEEAKLELGMF